MTSDRSNNSYGSDSIWQRLNEQPTPSSAVLESAINDDVLEWVLRAQGDEQEDAGQWLASIGTGAATGAGTGAVAGPWGALIGGLVGAGLGAVQQAIREKAPAAGSTPKSPPQPPPPQASPKPSPQISGGPSTVQGTAPRDATSPTTLQQLSQLLPQLLQVLQAVQPLLASSSQRESESTETSEPWRDEIYTESETQPDESVAEQSFAEPTHSHLDSPLNATTLAAVSPLFQSYEWN